MSDHDLDALEAVAKAATQNDWQVLDNIHGDPIVHEVGRGILSGGGVATAFHREDYGRANAAHIATFDPPTVLALIERLRQAEAERDRWKGVTADQEDSAERRRTEAAALRRQVADLTAERDEARAQHEECHRRVRAAAEAAGQKVAALAEVVERINKALGSFHASDDVHAATILLVGRLEGALSLVAAAPTPPAETEEAAGSGYCPDACTWPHDHRFERDGVPWPARGEPAIERCPECRHMPHGSLGFCPNLASDHDCSCTYTPPTTDAEEATEA